MSSGAVGPVISPQSRLSHVDMPSDAVMTTSSHAAQWETLAEDSVKPHRVDNTASCHMSNVQSSVKTYAMHESSESISAAGQSTNLGRPKAVRLAAYYTYLQ